MSIRWLFVSLLLASLSIWYLYEPVGPADSWALQTFMQKDYLSAEKLVTRTRGQIDESRYFLNKAYIASAQQNFSLAAVHLEHSYTGLGAKSADSLYREWLWNKALLAFLTQNQTGIQQALCWAPEVWNNEDPWWRWFSGWLAFEQSQYVKAYNAWQELGPLPVYSPWMKAAVELYFPSAWREEYRLQAAIFAGHYRTVRADLQEQTGDNPAMSALTPATQKALLLLTYVREAKEYSPDIAYNFYEKAWQYLDDEVSTDPLREKGQTWLREQLLETTQQLLTLRLYEQIPFYIQATEHWSKTPQWPAFIALLGDHLQQPDINSEKFFKYLPQGVTAEALHKHLLERSCKALQKDDQLWAYQWATWAQELSADTAGCHSYLASHTLDLLEEQLTEPVFEQLARALAFWKKFEKRPSEHLAMAFKLLQRAYGSCLEESRLQQGLELMQLALAVGPAAYEGSIRQEIGQTLTTLYHQFIVQESYPNLLSLLEMQRQLKIPHLAYQSDSEMAHLLTDGYYLYQKGSYNQAYSIAQWVLAHRPQDIGASRLAAYAAAALY